MLVVFLLITIIILLAVCVLSIFYVYRFARIILLLEDDFPEVIEVHERTVATFNKILGLQLFFDSPGVRPILDEALNDIKICKVATQRLITKFTMFSKRKYILDQTTTSEEDN